jgi:peptide-methionine (S)-S-oxide reductase
LTRRRSPTANDPTELNRQGPDSGPSYRSEIFFTSPTQERVAKAYVAQLNQGKVFGKPIATKIEAMKGFYPAEGYHQDYLIHNPTQPYIVRNDLPKIEALKKVYPELYRETQVMLTSAR